MRNTFAIARREFQSYVNSPIAYILVTMYVAASGYLFFRGLFFGRQADMRPFFELMPLLFALLVPMLTMRTIAEERREGTLELLLTLPLTDAQLISDKFIAALGLMATLLVLTLAFPITVSFLGPLDWGTTIAGYIGALLMAGAYVAIGVMSSSFVRSQIGAALIGFGIGFGLYLVGATVAYWPPSLQSLAQALSPTTHFMNIARGVIDLRDFVYYASMITGCLIVAHTTLESRRWR
jgi:ABC-2 type transport system permease protein